MLLCLLFHVSKKIGTLELTQDSNLTKLSRKRGKKKKKNQKNSRERNLTKSLNELCYYGLLSTFLFSATLLSFFFSPSVYLVSTELFAPTRLRPIVSYYNVPVNSSVSLTISSSSDLAVCVCSISP